MPRLMLNNICTGAMLTLLCEGPFLAWVRSMFIQVRDTPNEHRFAPAPRRSNNATLASHCRLISRSLMFLPGRAVLGSGTAQFNALGEAKSSPLARCAASAPARGNIDPFHGSSLFRIEGVKQVFLAADFITVIKARGLPTSRGVHSWQDDAHAWGVIKPNINAAIMDFFASNQPVLLETAKVDTDTGAARAVRPTTTRAQRSRPATAKWWR